MLLQNFFKISLLQKVVILRIFSLIASCHALEVNSTRDGAAELKHSAVQGQFKT